MKVLVLVQYEDLAMLRGAFPVHSNLSRDAIKTSHELEQFSKHSHSLRQRDDILLTSNMPLHGWRIRCNYSTRDATVDEDIHE